MKRRQWSKLGKELQSLRLAQDLTQEIVVTLLGDTTGERTLRAYEIGEQRPKRNRLLKLLSGPFELTNPAKINRFLRLAHYADLSEREIAEHKLSTASSHQKPYVDGVGPPADFRLEARTLCVTDGQARVIWRHAFPTRFVTAAYEMQATTKCTFGDIDGDGCVETLFVFAPLNFGSVGSTLFCFAQDGTIKWQFEPGRTLKDTRQEYHPPYFISNVVLLPLPNRNPRILVSSNHHLHNPNQIAMLDSKGKLISEYWHSGHLLHITHFDINRDGIEEVLLAGVNNGYRQATLVIFDPRNVRGASVQPGRQILGFPAGTEKSVVLFPRTCVSQNSPYNRVTGLHVTRERRIVLAIAEGVSEGRNPGVMIYELDFGLNVLSARPDSHLQESHRMMQLEGKLDHSWTEEENRDLAQSVAIKRKS